ncbi:formylglycine-generating enzyme family protein [Hyphomonas johnsonii]|uniref:Sulfatase-modifying factor enzyme-like domain-containing protein n=1 Tax=Hyphomonas johnsonii MHS-2 TaxID=1280950 RepID=A0A059FBD3_9PROT|nr:formylglycine-generating enzyme family protein [Hyphomonas johnsonii]KCZ87924.1 hypothetical protein HJO_16110 [Hyphomonas johnsonii MHS-2]
MTGHTSRPILAQAAVWAAVTVFTLVGCDRAPAGETAPARTEPSCPAAPGVQTVDVPSGDFLMGSQDTYPEEAPVRATEVAAFSLDATEVTNAEFSEFVGATGYTTVAERKPDPARVPRGAPREFFLPGAVVFTQPDTPTQTWWRYVPGANWRHPEGPGSDIRGKANYPVVQVAYSDASAYAAWKGRRLPSEAEWEYAARSGRAATRYAWGDEADSKGSRRANTWQGLFPITNTADDGFELRAPVGCFAPTPWGLYDMIGNVWEWTSTPYGAGIAQQGEPVLAIKGGSFLCAPNFCARYRPPARQGQEAGLPTNHIGFRTAKSAAPSR